MSCLILHNGNQVVKPWAAAFYKCETRPCLTDPWPDAADLFEKYQRATTLDICTDLTTADTFNSKELFTASENFKVVKVITSYEHDVANLEPVWNQGYSKSQWLQSTFTRLIFADKIVFQEPIVFECSETEPDIVFTPGRSGTNVLRDITGVRNYLHHNDNLLIKDQFSTLVNATKICGILRKKFIDQVVSDAISQRYDTMLSTRTTFDENYQQVLTWDPITLTDSDYLATLTKICNYADIILGLKIFYNKKIEFSLLEELHEHFNKITHVKNPYRAEQIVANYQIAVDTCQRHYQPSYNKIITSLQQAFGTHLYNYV